MIVQPHCPLILAQVLTMHLFARAQRHRANHMPKPKRADCFPPAVPQCIAMGSSMESVHTAMSPRKTELRNPLNSQFSTPTNTVMPKT